MNSKQYAPEHREVLIVGAGFSGLANLHLLRRAGIDAVIVEASDDVGGTWHANRYPGVRTDSESHYYCLSFAQEVTDSWSWTERYPKGAEVHAYLRHVADKLELIPHVRFNSRVTSLTWDSSHQRWYVSLDNGDTMTAGRVVLGTGLLQQPVMPNIPGIADFEGELVHTSRWPQDIDLSGKRVGVIGGSSQMRV